MRRRRQYRNPLQMGIGLNLLFLLGAYVLIVMFAAKKTRGIFL